MDSLRPALLAHCGIGLWVSLIDSPIVKLYHTETFKHLQDINVASNVKRVLQEPVDIPIVVTSMLATRGLLWIGTSLGFVLTLSLPRLQGVPLVSGCLNVSLHRHLGPVSILLSLTPAAQATGVGGGRAQNRNNIGRNGSDTIESKGTDIESIYGLYADLMKVDDYMGTETARSSASTASTVIVSNVSAPGITGGMQQQQSAGGGNSTGSGGGNGGQSVATSGRLAWELSNMTMSDDSTSESASSGRIYQDGVKQALTNAQGNVPSNNSSGNGTSTMHSPVDQSAGQSLDGKSGNKSNDERSIYDARRTLSSANGFHGLSQPSGNQVSAVGSNIVDNVTPTHLVGAGAGVSGAVGNVRSQSVDSNGAGGSSIYESSGMAVPMCLSNPTPPTSTASNLKTALLITGGNGFKRGTLSNPYSSQHAHCIIWEYKL